MRTAPLKFINGRYTCQVTLAQALKHDLFVTVETAEGDVFVGTLVAVSFDQVAVNTGLRGRPQIIDVEDIEAILTAKRGNPHIEPVKRSTGIKRARITVNPDAKPGKRIVVEPSTDCELKCKRCGETYYDSEGEMHFETEDGKPCGGDGRVVRRRVVSFPSSLGRNWA